jgi:hypothetical protein
MYGMDYDNGFNFIAKAAGTVVPATMNEAKLQWKMMEAIMDAIEARGISLDRASFEDSFYEEEPRA